MHPHDRVRLRRPIQGHSAVLLPFGAGGRPDLDAFAAHLRRTVGAGLVPAVNMDTGYVQALDAATRIRVLDLAAEACPDGFVGGAQVDDEPGDPYDAGRYVEQAAAVAERGGTPIVFPSYGLSALEPAAWAAAHAELAEEVGALLAFELGEMFVPYGRIHPLEAYRKLLDVPGVLGAKHSSLSRQAEWDRLALRDDHRPDFLVLTGNDLAIDMVAYGSDYLLGLSTFAPDLFARRDALWETGDPAFYELNDGLQALGAFAFRAPVPAYRHSAAQFLALRGWLDGDHTPPGAPRRPDHDREVLTELGRRLGIVA